MIPPEHAAARWTELCDGDRGDRVPRLGDRLRVGVEVEVTLFLLGVAPRDREHLLPLGDVVLDHAPPRRDVEHVELVDRRRDEQQRHLPHLIGRRLVMDQLEHVGPEHDRSGRGRDIDADLELARVDGRRQSRRRVQIVHEVPRAADQIAAAGVDDLLDHRRIGPGKVGRGERVEDVPGREPRAPLGAPVDIGVGDQPVDGLADGQIALEQRPEQPVALPRGVGETPVALGGRQLRAAGRRAGELGAEAGGAADHPLGAAREPGADLDGRARRDEPRRAAGRGVAQHHVQARPSRLARAPDAGLLLGLSCRVLAHRSSPRCACALRLAAPRPPRIGSAT